MAITKREQQRITHTENTLCNLGFTPDEARALRRISMTLRRWHELECGTGEGQVSISVERDTDGGKPFKRVQYPTRSGYVDKRFPIADRETGARKRLAAIVAARNDRAIGRVLAEESENEITVKPYVQGDPRGAALYILRPGDIPEGQTADSCYSRGICVY